MKITTLMDNIPSEHKSLHAEHGLSFRIETDHVNVLFDFGAGNRTLENARALKTDLTAFDYAVGSHGHYDHAGGYPSLVKAGLSCPFVTGPGYFEEKYAAGQDPCPKFTYLGTGFSSDFLKEQQISHIVCDSLLQLSPDCWVFGNFRRSQTFEQIPDRFVLRKGGTWEKDLFQDEVCLVVSRPQGLVVILGCSHPGILNILYSVQEHFKTPVYGVVGGTHLVEADRPRIRTTIAAMKDMGIRLMGFNHCSGPLLKEMLQEEQDLDTVYLGAGDCLFL